MPPIITFNYFVKHRTKALSHRPPHWSQKGKDTLEQLIGKSDYRDEFKDSIRRAAKTSSTFARPCG